MEGFWNLGLEKPLSVELSELFCRSLEGKNVESNADVKAWLVKFQREAKMIVCERYVVFGQ